MKQPAVRLAILTTLLLAVCLSCVGAALATSPTATPAPPSGTIVEVGHDATVAPEDVADDAVAVGGDVTSPAPCVARPWRWAATSCCCPPPSCLATPSASAATSTGNQAPPCMATWSQRVSGSSAAPLRFGTARRARLASFPRRHPPRLGRLDELDGRRRALHPPALRRAIAVGDRVVQPPPDVDRLGSPHSRCSRAHLERAAARHRGRHPGPHPLAAHRGPASAVLRLHQQRRRARQPPGRRRRTTA